MQNSVAASGSARGPRVRAAVAWGLGMFGGPLAVVVVVPLAVQAFVVLDKDDRNGRDLAVGALVATLAWVLALALFMVTDA